jgi:nucleoside phosphorylase
MICILAALKREIDSVLDMAQGVVKEKTAGCVRYTCSINGLQCTVVRTGTGEKRIDPEVVRGCSEVLSTGFCGALVPGMEAGDIVISKKILYVDDYILDMILAGNRPQEASGKAVEFAYQKIAHPGWFLEAEREWEGIFAKKNVSLWKGTTLTVARIIKTRAQKATLENVTGAMSVEMEDMHRMELCTELGIPFFSIRAVLDSADDEIPGIQRGLRLYSDFRILLEHLSAAQNSIALFFDVFFGGFPREPNFP